MKIQKLKSLKRHKNKVMMTLEIKLSHHKHHLIIIKNINKNFWKKHHLS